MFSSITNVLLQISQVENAHSESLLHLDSFVFFCHKETIATLMSKVKFLIFFFTKIFHVGNFWPRGLQPKKAEEKVQEVFVQICATKSLGSSISNWRLLGPLDFALQGFKKFKRFQEMSKSGSQIYSENLREIQLTMFEKYSMKRSDTFFCDTQNAELQILVVG